jgi:hypothetical protein
LTALSSDSIGIASIHSSPVSRVTAGAAEFLTFNPGDAATGPFVEAKHFDAPSAEEVLRRTVSRVTRCFSKRQSVPFRNHSKESAMTRNIGSGFVLFVGASGLSLSR